MAKTRTLQDLIESGTFDEVYNKLCHLGDGIIKQTGLSNLELFLTKYQDYDQRKSFIETMLGKIRTFEVGDQSKVTDFTPIKALCLKTLGKDTLKNEKAQESKDIKFLRHETALKSMEPANKLYQDLFEVEHTQEKLDKYLQHLQEIQSLITGMITDYGDLEEGIRLAKLSAQLRDRNFGVAHPNTLQTLLLLAGLGTKSTVYDTQIKCLKDAEFAYNVICNRTINEKSAEQLKSLLSHMSAYYSSFKDEGKAQELKNEVASLAQKFSAPKKTSSIEAIEEERTLILKKGTTDEKTLKVKSLIQESVLNPIQEAAAKAKWHEQKGFTYSSYASVDYGVAGYVDEVFLKKILGASFADTYEIALGLCFEAINIGIMRTPNKNPLVAAIFCTKFPGIIKDILKKHPEYFVDGHILKTSLLGASNYSKELLGEEKVTVNSGYNKFFEASIAPFVTKRIEPTVLTPLKNLVAGDGWSSWHTGEVKKYLSDEFLLKGYMTSLPALGNNFAQIPDIINIARILAFKTLVKAITDKGSTNFNPIEVFIKTYPDLNMRIMKDHPEYYLNNNFISKLCSNAQFQHSAGISSDKLDFFQSAIIDPSKQDTKNVLGANDHQDPDITD